MASNSRKLNIAVLMGGASTEHEVSLSSGLSVIKSLNPEKYNIKVIKIQRDGQWQVLPGYLKELPSEIDQKYLDQNLSGIAPLSPNLALDKTDQDKVDLAFIALHGKYGEDGSIQGLLEIAGVPYTGSGVLASALAMDKEKSNEIYHFHGLTVPPYLVFSEKDYLTDYGRILSETESKLGFPCVLKPADGGSSVGTFIIKGNNNLSERIKEDFAISKKLMLQKYIKGEEVTCAVLDTGSGFAALPPTLIIAQRGEFYDYSAKYETGGSKHIVPAPLPENKILEIQKIALKAHQVLGCSGLTRTDMILKDNQIYVLETNTIPGMTPTSLAPEAAQASGISFTELLDRLVEAAVAKSR